MKQFTKWFSIAVVAAFTLLAVVACGGPDTFMGAGGSASLARGGSSKANIRINVVLNTQITDSIRVEISGIGRIADEIQSIDALVVQGRAEIIDDLLALSYVDSANPDAVRNAPPVVGDGVDDILAYGLSTWDLDAINVTDVIWDDGEPVATGRVMPSTGSGVYVAVLDTGLTKNWRDYFPEERIASQYGASFGGGGGEVGATSMQPNKWEHDTDSHGTHVTSTVIGYSFRGTPINGVAPGVQIIPVKVLNNNGSGWSSVVAAGITYIGDLKAGPLADSPVVINMSLGGPELDGIEKEAIDYAIEQGVLIVASAGNNGTDGMGYPGAYAPVISVAASGWTGEWIAAGWPFFPDVAEAYDQNDYYIAGFSSRELAGQDLDVAAPGTWVVGPYQVNEGQNSYYYLGGTSMASPHVAGIVALMAQKNGSLVQADVESILEGAALPLDPGTRNIYTPWGYVQTFSWGADATGSGLITADGALAATPSP